MFSKTLIASLCLTAAALALPFSLRDTQYKAVIRYFYVPKNYVLACGSSSYTNDSFILEAPDAIFQDGAQCGTKIKVFGPSGKSAVGEIQDKCGEGCGLNLSPAFFKALAPLSQGRFDGKWEYTDDPVGSSSS